MIFTSEVLEVLVGVSKSKEILKGIFLILGIAGISIGLFLDTVKKNIICTIRSIKCNTRNNSNKSIIQCYLRKRNIISITIYSNKSNTVYITEYKNISKSSKGNV